MRTFRHVPIPAGLALVLALAAAGCGRAEDHGAGTVLPDPVGRWAVESLTTGGRTLHAPESARLDFGADQVKGNYGCNGFTAAVSFSGTSAVTVTPGATTTMACEDMEFETAFATLFTGRLTIDRGPDRLTLKTPDGSTIAMTSAPADPDAPLTAVEWTVQSLISGTSVSSLPAGAAGTARFTIAADLSVSGTLGCNRFSARVTRDGDRLTFGPLTTTRMACDGPAGEVEAQLTDLFASGPLATRIEGRRLTLTAADGTGLIAEAPSDAE
ncbi:MULTISPECIES: META domain-containing protein [unclassified Streptomyces]|uniref:META domain-containing protein n=1 Tax=unclassified Streptomyces TaxID=2593676 RepID=UPI000449063E|nr:META domain-containing protein [Streptomyces sp. PCS3-D2]WKV73208.1 META domain-containing protein [Streptomyces sp. PCS3-D2]